MARKGKDAKGTKTFESLPPPVDQVMPGVQTLLVQSTAERTWPLAQGLTRADWTMKRGPCVWWQRVVWARSWGTWPQAPDWTDHYGRMNLKRYPSRPFLSRGHHPCSDHPQSLRLDPSTLSSAQACASVSHPIESGPGTRAFVQTDKGRSELFVRTKKDTCVSTFSDQRD